MNQNTYEYNYDCARCEKNFINKIDIERHLNKKEKCKSKNNNFFLSDKEVMILSCIKTSKKNFYINEKKINDNELICKFCYSEYKNKSLLNAHIKICNLEDDYKNIVNICKKLNVIKNSKNNFIEINKIKSFDENYNDNYLTIDSKSNILIRLDGYYTLNIILKNIENLNILPINTYMSCIIINKNNEKKIKKINNVLLEEILTFKIKRYLLNIKNELKKNKQITERLFNVLEEEINHIFKKPHFEFIHVIKNYMKNLDIQYLYHFIPENIPLNNFNNYQDLYEYYKSNLDEYIYEVYGFHDNNVSNHNETNKIYAESGIILTIENIWKINLNNTNNQNNILNYKNNNIFLKNKINNSNKSESSKSDSSKSDSSKSDSSKSDSSESDSSESDSSESDSSESDSEIENYLTNNNQINKKENQNFIFF